MNIFYLHEDPEICAQMHLDKHVVKMCIEYAQLLSTAHRYLDGSEYTELSQGGRRIKRWRLNDIRDTVLMKVTHINHPSAIWCRENKQNYAWLQKMWVFLLNEYTHRYGSVHACSRLTPWLVNYPENIKEGEFFAPTPAMPKEIKIISEKVIPGRKYDVLKSYHNYYILNKSHMAKWTKRNVPTWFSEGLSHANL